MLGKRPEQRGLLEAGHLYLNHVGRDSFYGFLGSMRGQLFRDEEFAELYYPDNGRDSVAPSLLALRHHKLTSETEAMWPCGRPFPPTAASPLSHLR